MRSVIIIGYGNVAQALSAAIHALDGFYIKQVLYRSPEKLEHQPPFRIVTTPGELEEADIYLLCVNDDAITSVSESLPFNDRLVVHTSGSMPMDSLKAHVRRGVFYPLQSFTRGKSVTWDKVSFCLESSKKQDLDLMRSLAEGLSEKVYNISTEQRKKLHLAAVVVNNFTNHLFHLGATICKENEIPFEVLHPLIEETVDKIKTVEPYEAQTGPARRNDQKTLNSQLLQVRNTPLEEVYKVLTASIIATYEREKL